MKQQQQQPMKTANHFQYHSSLNLATYPDKLWTDAQVPYMLEEGMTHASVI